MSTHSLQDPNDESKVGFHQSFPLRTSELIGLPSRGREMLTGARGTPKVAHWIVQWSSPPLLP